MITETKLKKELFSAVEKQGYFFSKNRFVLKRNSRLAVRSVHSLAKAERIVNHRDFIMEMLDKSKSSILDGKNLDVEKISPRLISVESKTHWADFFRWWNLVWWSLPYDPAYGRQMRYIVWDDYHEAPIGLIGLQSPILCWSVRDQHLGINAQKRDYWVNQSLSAQRLGALPPYNSVLGGKLVASLMTTEQVRSDFSEKYKGQKTIIKGRTLPARLLFITTTGAFGKSSVYNRLKYQGYPISKFIGYSYGSGSFHIPNSLYEKMVTYLEQEEGCLERGFGNGPSRKMRLIDKALEKLGISNGVDHGVKRAVYLFPFARNLKNVIQNDVRPLWHHRNVEELTDYWKTRWALPRAGKNETYKNFNYGNFRKQVLLNLRKCRAAVSETL
jgi:hypothetical protein